MLRALCYRYDVTMNFFITYQKFTGVIADISSWTQKMTSCVTTLSHLIAFGVIAPRHRFIVCSYKCNISICASNLSGPQYCTFVFCSGRNETIKLEGSKEKETLNLGSTNLSYTRGNSQQSWAIQNSMRKLMCYFQRKYSFKIATKSDP